jgi:hypothetical protein
MDNENTLILNELRKISSLSKSLLEFHETQNLPPDAESIDIQKLCNVDKSTDNFLFMSLKAKENEQIVITHYAIYTDALDATKISFVPRLNGSRCLRYHGVPNDNANPTAWNLTLGLCPDLSENSLRKALLILKPNQKLEWFVSNFDTANSLPMGIRIKGYSRTLAKITESQNK